jgi:hypothetical protein
MGSQKVPSLDEASWLNGTDGATPYALAAKWTKDEFDRFMANVP